MIGVVEPFFLNPDLCKNPPSAFTDYVNETSSVRLWPPTVNLQYVHSTLSNNLA